MIGGFGSHSLAKQAVGGGVFMANLTFCLARDLIKVDFGMTLAAVTFFVSKLVNSKH